MNKYFLSILFAVMLLGACQKEAGFSEDLGDGEEPVTPSNPSNTATLLIGTWKMTGNTVSPEMDYDIDGTKETNVFPVMDACEKDGTIVFNTDMKVTEDEGPTKCDTDDPQSVTMIWSLSADNKILTLEGSGTREIVSISATKLVMKIKFSGFGDGVEYTFTTTFTKQ
jgi:hypothetical protein